MGTYRVEIDTMYGSKLSTKVLTGVDDYYITKDDRPYFHWDCVNGNMGSTNINCIKGLRITKESNDD